MNKKRTSAIILLVLTLFTSMVLTFLGQVFWGLLLMLGGMISSGLILYFAAGDDIIRKEMTATGGDNDEYNPDYTDNNPDNAVTFDSIAGMEEIKEEILEIADFIKNPEKYERFGATLPRGVLFYGPPGTGKTMIAKALANETDTAFIYASGSEFIEKYVGVGAGRIRNLFEKARKHKNCIIFIDEIDAIGSSRNSDSNSERDQTLNQLLTELDGFKKKEGIVVIGATNRLDLLDKALVRPGRFDRHIYVGNPSESARAEILSVYMEGKPVATDVDIKKIASRTASMSGAELKNVVNEAAIFAIRNAHDEIENSDFDEALLKIMAGLKNKSVNLSGDNLRTVSVHEAGHAVTHIVLNENIPLKISVISRNTALGMVVTGSSGDNDLPDRTDIEKQICVLLSGRAAEEIVCGKITTGAQNDLKRANELAYSMYYDFGMSESCFNMTLSDKQGEDFKNFADRFVNDTLKKCYDISKKIIRDNICLVEDISKLLIKNKTVEEDEIIVILSNYRKITANG